MFNMPNIPSDIKKYAILKMAIPPEMNELRNKYEEKVNQHNLEMLTTYYNSGFDLLFSTDQDIVENFTTTFVNLNVKTEMAYVDRSITCSCNTVSVNNTLNQELCSRDNSEYFEPCGFFVFPRSSMSKSPLILANHTGIIDASYRGNLIVAVRKCPQNVDGNGVFEIRKYERLFQITHPSLCRIFVVLVEENELSTTARGDGGFGSTGKF